MKSNSLFSVLGHRAFDGDAIELSQILYFGRIKQPTKNSSGTIKHLYKIKVCKRYHHTYVVIDICK